MKGLVAVAVAILVLVGPATAAAYTPDPPPGAKKPVTRVASVVVWTPAINVANGLPVPGLWFKCTLHLHHQMTCSKPRHR